MEEREAAEEGTFDDARRNEAPHLRRAGVQHAVGWVRGLGLMPFCLLALVALYLESDYIRIRCVKVTR